MEALDLWGGGAEGNGGRGDGVGGVQPALAQPCSALALGVVEKGLKGDTTCGCPAQGPRAPLLEGGGALCLCAGAPSQPPLKKNNYRATLRGSWRPAIDGLGEKRQKRGLSGWAGLASGIPAFGWGKLLFSVRTQPPPLLVPPFFFF